MVIAGRAAAIESDFCQAFDLVSRAGWYGVINQCVCWVGSQGLGVFLRVATQPSTDISSLTPQVNLSGDSRPGDCLVGVFW